MRRFPKLLFAGAAVALLFGAAAIAAEANTHVLTIQLPNGGVERIHYSGKTPPQVEIQPGAPMGPLVAFSGPADANGPFAMMRRMQAEMDREMAAMMRGAPMVMLPAPGGQALEQADLAKLPPGGASYSAVSTFSGGHMCSQSVEITSQGPGKPPKVVRQSSGDCTAEQAAPSVAAPPPAATAHGADQSI